MVLLKNLVFFFVSLTAAFPSPSTGTDGSESALQTRELFDIDSHAPHVVESNIIETRQASRMTLQWSPQGTFIFLCGMNFPLGIHDSLIESGQGSPGKLLLEGFLNFLDEEAFNSGRGMRARSLYYVAIKGGVFGVGAGAVQFTYGLGLHLGQLPAAGDAQLMLDMITKWAGGLVQVSLRPNGFWDPDTFHNHKRSRTNQCPHIDNILQYATSDVPDLDLNRDIRWAGECAP